MGIYELGCLWGYILMWTEVVRFQGLQQNKATLLCYHNSSGSRNTLGFTVNGYLKSLKG